jgi:hypothetical protein
MRQRRASILYNTPRLQVFDPLGAFFLRKIWKNEKNWMKFIIPLSGLDAFWGILQG